MRTTSWLFQHWDEWILPGAVWGGLQNSGSWIAMETGYRISAARMAWWKYGGLRERERTPRRSSAEVSCWSQRASVFVMPVMLVGRVFFLVWKVRWTSRCAVIVMFRESSGLFGYFSGKGTSLKAAFLKVTFVAVHLWLILAQGLLIQKNPAGGLYYSLIYAIQRLDRSKSSPERGFPFPSFSQTCEQSCDIDQQKDSCNIRETVVSWNWGRPPWNSDFLRGSKSRWLMCFPFPGHHHAGRVKLAIFESLGSLI